MSNLTIRASVKRLKPTKELWDLKLVDQSRCIFRYEQERLSVSVFNIDGGEIEPDSEKSCEITFLAAEHISSKISEGESFDLAVADTVIATGEVTKVL